MIAGLVLRSSHRIASFVLLGSGVVMVFAGLAAALGFSVTGMIASAAAIAALLYAGGVWLGPSAGADVSVVLFTPALTVAAGAHAGRAVADLYPPALRTEIEARCRAAIDGRGERFSPAPGRSFETAAVRAADGTIVYGLLLVDAATPGRAAATG
jgi:hypothetical protein